MEAVQKLRNLILSDEFLAFYNEQSSEIQKKFDFVMNVLRTIKVPSTKFVKRLENTEFYEMRVSVGNNEYRSVIFTIDNDNVINAIQILLLNSFLKKSTKDYVKNIHFAEQIIQKYEEK